MSGGDWLISSIAATVIQAMRVPDLNIVEWIVTLWALITIGITAISIMIPVQLKFGGDKGRRFTMSVMTGGGFIRLEIAGNQNISYIP